MTFIMVRGGQSTSWAYNNSDNGDERRGRQGLGAWGTIESLF